MIIELICLPSHCNKRGKVGIGALVVTIKIEIVKSANACKCSALIVNWNESFEKFTSSRCIDSLLAKFLDDKRVAFIAQM
jgi:hypothetical protein